jgi:hypothetical protein
LKIDDGDFARIVSRIRANRREARAALIRRWQNEFRQARAKPGETDDLDGDLSVYEPTQRELWNFCRGVVDDPRLLLQGNVLAPMTFYLARAYLEQKPQFPLSSEEIASMVDRLTESLPLGEARSRVAKMTGKTEEAVTIAHRRYRATR